jgi:molybdopterin-guanine dinucleotide biosynthesis protein A
MEFEAGGPALKPLLLIGGQSSRMGSRKELVQFPDGRLVFERALGTLHSAIPSASTIYISLHDEIQTKGIKSRLRDPSQIFRTAQSTSDHPENPVPELEPIFDDQKEDIGPAAGLLAAHAKFPNSKWLVLGCDYPLLPPSALQQLILEFHSPVTCFLNESGFAEPLIAIWDFEALKKLKENVSNGRYGLNGVIKQVGGRMVKPLREEWIKGANTKEEWDEAMAVATSREKAH